MRPRDRKKVGAVITDSSTQTERAEQTQKLRQRGVQKTQNDKGHSQDKNDLVKSFPHSGGKREWITDWIPEQMPEWIKTVSMDPIDVR